MPTTLSGSYGGYRAMPTQRSASYLDEVTTEKTIVTSAPAAPVLVVPLDEEAAHGLLKLFS